MLWNPGRKPESLAAPKLGLAILGRNRASCRSRTRSPRPWEIGLPPRRGLTLRKRVDARMQPGACQAIRPQAKEYVAGHCDNPRTEGSPAASGTQGACQPLAGTVCADARRRLRPAPWSYRLRPLACSNSIQLNEPPRKHGRQGANDIDHHDQHQDSPPFITHITWLRCDGHTLPGRRKAFASDDGMSLASCRTTAAGSTRSRATVDSPEQPGVRAASDAHRRSTPADRRRARMRASIVLRPFRGGGTPDTFSGDTAPAV